ncbi:MAG: response regulator transcription factor [Bacteroidota bacterium]|nr:response regulator transcription factor [Bacteroidota bacterium]MDP4245699.1 response regulator transcription factor [Bacteroidota bacterium]MDP4254098.1 response regulator transcription factor [Bacteroidota bacterium]MDP4260332.1 response regulator transcription factor [Bacteroidota bacterium]
MLTGVIIYEDNVQLRESIAEMITQSGDYVLLGSFPNVLNVKKQVNELDPDIILMDIDMPGGISGIDAVIKIRSFNQRVLIIMLTVFDDNEIVLDAICAGASGYLLKKDLSTRLPEAMLEVLSGGAPMTPSVARMVINSMQNKPKAGNNRYQLTHRETEMLLALSKGFGYKTIALENHISLETVRSHIKNIYEKMQVHSQLEAIAKGKDDGIIR